MVCLSDHRLMCEMIILLTWKDATPSPIYDSDLGPIPKVLGILTDLLRRPAMEYNNLVSNPKSSVVWINYDSAVFFKVLNNQTVMVHHDHFFNLAWPPTTQKQTICQFMWFISNQIFFCIKHEKIASYKNHCCKFDLKTIDQIGTSLYIYSYIFNFIVKWS